VGVNTPFSLTGTSQTYNVRVSNCDWGGAANWLAMGTSSTYNLWWSNLGADAGGRPGISAGTTCTRRVRSSDGSFTIDGTLITSFDNGCIYVNSNAGFGAGAGTYAHGPGGPTRIAV
jgi:hypothetical protein